MVVGILEVNLINAKGLPSTDILGKIDPYVVIEYKGQTHKSSVARGGGRNPTWNETFRLRVEYPASDGNYKILLKILDHDTFSEDDSLGHATVYVKEVMEMGIEKGKAEVHPTKYSVVGADQKYCGEVLVGLTFTLTGERNIDEEEFGGWKESQFD